MLTYRTSVIAAAIPLLLFIGSQMCWASPAGSGDGPVTVVGGGGGQGTGTGGTDVTTTVRAGGTSKPGSVVGQPVSLRGGAGVGAGSGAAVLLPDPCREVPLAPQPGPGSAWWGGHQAAQGQVVHWVCTGGVEPAVLVPFFLATGAVAVPPPPDPAVLARAAEAQVVTLLPPPSLTVSPDLPHNIDAHIGMPVTYVNLWFWFWTEPATWQPFSGTAALNGVSATTTARPVSLSYDPGDGAAPVVCAWQGMPWIDADANNDPATVGGCGYKYLKVTAGGPITGTLTLTWQVRWTSSTGAAGALDPLTTTTKTPPFVVEQIRVVTK